MIPTYKLIAFDGTMPKDQMRSLTPHAGAADGGGISKVTAQGMDLMLQAENVISSERYSQDPSLKIISCSACRSLFIAN
jgi:hypothetical protein